MSTNDLDKRQEPGVASVFTHGSLSQLKWHNGTNNKKHEAKGKPHSLEGVKRKFCVPKSFKSTKAGAKQEVEMVDATYSNVACLLWDGHAAISMPKFRSIIPKRGGK